MTGLHDPHAEARVAGAVIVSAKWARQARAGLRPDDFYDPRAARVLDASTELDDLPGRANVRAGCLSVLADVDLSTLTTWFAMAWITPALLDDIATAGERRRVAERLEDFARDLAAGADLGAVRAQLERLVGEAA